MKDGTIGEEKNNPCSVELRTLVCLFICRTRQPDSWLSCISDRAAAVLRHPNASSLLCNRTQHFSFSEMRVSAVPHTLRQLRWCSTSGKGRVTVESQAVPHHPDWMTPDGWTDYYSRLMGTRGWAVVLFSWQLLQLKHCSAGSRALESDLQHRGGCSSGCCI